MIQRQIFIDLIKTTVLCLVGVSALLMLIVAMIQVARNGLDPLAVLKVIPFLLPPLLTYTIPTCLLFACTVVYGGMSSSNEIVALKSVGIHANRILGPVVFLAVVLAGASVYLADSVIPAANKAFRNALISDLQGSIYAYIKQKGELVESGMPYELYVRTVSGRELIDPIIKHRGPNGEYDMIAQAAKATLEIAYVDGEPIVLIRLLDGVVVTDVQNAVHFRDRTEEMPVPKLFQQEQTHLEALTFAECWQKGEQYRIQALATAAEIESFPQPELQQEKLEELKSDLSRFERKAREMNAEVHVRLAQATATIPFVLLGCPISILFRRREFLQAFFVCYLPIIVGFYPAMILAYNVVKEGGCTVSALVWAPAGVLALMAIPFYRRVVRH